MLDAEKLLGSLLKQGLRSGRRSRRRSRSSSLGRLAGGSFLGLGVLGVAVAAFEHFTQKKSSSPPAGQTFTPAHGPAGSSAVPPPPPPPTTRSSPPPPPPPAATVGQSEAALLVQAMVAASNADGNIDAEEIKSIRRRMSEAGLSEEARTFLDQQLSQPPRLEDILAAVQDPRLAVQVYAVTLAAIDVDTDAERHYLERLRAGLNIPSEVIRRLHVDFEIEDQ